MIKVGFSYERKMPREEWERDLWTIAPPSEHLSWLKLWHVTGDAWEPVDRWFIFQMRAPKLIANRVDLLKELRGPHPRSTGRYDEKMKMWRGGAARQINRDQWDLFQATGHYGTPWWVIEGENGGYRYRLDKIESKISRLHGGPADTPIPGSLPYAEWDRRVFWKVAERDRVRAWKHVTDYSLRNHDQMDAEEEAEACHARELTWNWLESQVKQTVDKIGKSGCSALAEYQRNETATKDEGRQDLDRMQQDFIDTAA